MPAKQLTQEQFMERFNAFREVGSDVEAYKAWVASRAEVLLQHIEPQSTIRGQIFEVEQLGPGATPVYDLPFEDVECAFLMPQIGATPTVQLEGSQISASTFAVTAGVEFQREIATDGRFQVGDNATRMLLRKLLLLEESAGWALIKTHSAALPSTQKVQALLDNGNAASPGSGKLNLLTLNEVITVADELGEGGRTIAHIYVSPRRFNDMRNQLANTAMPESIREALYGNGAGANAPAGIRLHKVYNRNLVADNKAYCFSMKDGQAYGKMPVRTPLEMDPDITAYLERKVGLKAFSRYGMVALDDKALVELTF